MRLKLEIGQWVRFRSAGGIVRHGEVVAHGDVNLWSDPRGALSLAPGDDRIPITIPCYTFECESSDGGDVGVTQRFFSPLVSDIEPVEGPAGEEPEAPPPIPITDEQRGLLDRLTATVPTPASGNWVAPVGKDVAAALDQMVLRLLLLRRRVLDGTATPALVAVALVGGAAEELGEGAGAEIVTLAGDRYRVSSLLAQALRHVDNLVDTGA